MMHQFGKAWSTQVFCSFAMLQTTGLKSYADFCKNQLKALSLIPFKRLKVVWGKRFLWLLPDLKSALRWAVHVSLKFTILQKTVGFKKDFCSAPGCKRTRMHVAYGFFSLQFTASFLLSVQIRHFYGVNKADMKHQEYANKFTTWLHGLNASRASLVLNVSGNRNSKIE